MKIGFIGAGKMGSSILNGVKDKLFNKNNIFVYEINEEIKKSLKEKGVNLVSSIKELSNQVDVLVLAIKPQDFSLALVELKGCLEEKIIITIAAGIKIGYIESVIGSVKVARAMPNTAASIGEASSSICFNDKMEEVDKQLVIKIFNQIGKVVEINEEQMDDIIPIGGSFTAFEYYFYKGFLESSIKRGIDKEVAKKLLVQSIIGSAKMIESSEKDIDELIKDVCSKGGTTLAGLKVFEDNDLLKIIDDCAKACAERSKELGK